MQRRHRRTWLDGGGLQIGAVLLIGIALVANAYFTTIGTAEFTALKALLGADRSGPISREILPPVVVPLAEQR